MSPSFLLYYFLIIEVRKSLAEMISARLIFMSSAKILPVSDLHYDRVPK